MPTPRPLSRFATFAVLAVSAACILVAVSGCKSGRANRASAAANRSRDVSGRYIVSISDADMPATALADNRLTERDPSLADSLTVIQLPIREPETPWAQIPVSNSVIGPPDALAVSRDGNIAVVIESRGPAPAGGGYVDDLPKGEKLTGIDLTNPIRPSIFGVAIIGDNPTGVDIHPAGDLVVAVCEVPREQINIVPLVRSKGSPPVFGEALGWPLVGLDDDEAKPSSVAWHPSGNFLAVTIPDRNEVMFYRFSRDTGDGSFGLLPWGAPVKVGKYPYLGQFTPDGKFFITTDMQWGKDVPGFFVDSPEGRLSVVRFDADQKKGGVAHAVVSSAAVGINPEGLAISPDGTLVATANLKRSFLPAGDPRVSQGSISLLSLDKSGKLTARGEYAINAMPVALAFDAKGRFVVATQFRSFDPRAIDGELAFWRVEGKGKSASLNKANFVVGVGKGPHGVLIVR